MVRGIARAQQDSAGHTAAAGGGECGVRVSTDPFLQQPEEGFVSSRVVGLQRPRRHEEQRDC